ncbi:phosphoribosylformylglycinamidine synthase I [Candidatus Woesearchaeota archaeon]|nr:MAG: phosphoribosylformylglycinamidine synthase I [Candidatus Woesearchaeota archaeon]
MKRPKVLILVAPGTNCDKETKFCFDYVGAKSEFVSIKRLIENPKLLHNYHILCIPGGFTYGDDISAGRILANQIKYLIGKDLKKFYDDGKLILGICNGFQVLVKAGILPFYPFSEQKVSLALNTCARFIDTWVYLKVNKTNCIWTKDLPQIISLPIAHAEGRFCAEKEVISQIQSQIVFQYTDVNGEITPDANPNGSILNIAGITDREGRILGLMPHPERYSFSLQSPFWIEKRKIKEEPGLLIFKNGVKFVKDALLS